MRESVCLCGRQRNLVGIFTEPEDPIAAGKRSAVLLMNSGLLHRAAPHRMYVQLARRLASEGMAAFRFDFAGYGDSPEFTDRGNLSPEQKAIENTLDAMDFLEQEKEVSCFALTGICSGAYIAIRVACRDRRVLATVPINVPIELFSDNRQLIDELEKRGRAGQLGRNALLDSNRWQRLMKGQIRPKRIIELVALRLGREDSTAGNGGPGLTDEKQACLDVLQQLCGNGRSTCLVFSQEELGYDFLNRIVGRESLRSSAPTVELRLLENVDHLFIQHRASDRFIQEMCSWFVAHLPSGIPH